MHEDNTEDAGFVKKRFDNNSETYDLSEKTLEGRLHRELEWERILSPIFVESPTYGTRTSTLLFITQHNQVNFIEKTFSQENNHPSIKQFNFQIES